VINLRKSGQVDVSADRVPPLSIPKPLRCFPQREPQRSPVAALHSPLQPTSRSYATTAPPLADGGWLGRWMQQTAAANWHLGSAQEAALAGLVPLLLCGEQSAQTVFSQQATQLRRNSQTKMAQVLLAIEREEDQHERALQYLAGRLVAPPDIHGRKRRAQRFYTAMARDASPAEHFARIEALDSAVSRIMHSLSRASWGNTHPLYFLFDAIKADEARHVGVSRRYATELGISAAERARQRQLIGCRIVEFLLPDAAAFECIGVDPDKLFRLLQRGISA
jgi:hypothetical protein